MRITCRYAVPGSARPVGVPKTRWAPGHARAGVALNFNKLAGYQYLSSAAEAAARFNVSQVVALLERLDFLGFSNYPQVDDVTNLGLLESALFQLERELAYLGACVGGSSMLGSAQWLATEVQLRGLVVSNSGIFAAARRRQPGAAHPDAAAHLRRVWLWRRCQRGRHHARQDQCPGRLLLLLWRLWRLHQVGGCGKQGNSAPPAQRCPGLVAAHTTGRRPWTEASPADRAACMCSMLPGPRTPGRPGSPRLWMCPPAPPCEPCTT